MPVVWTLTGVPAVRAGVAEHAAVLVDEPGRLQPAVEELGDPGGAVGVPGQQHERRVVADLGAEVDLGHRCRSVGSGGGGSAGRSGV